jgi:hypothetical protein
MRWSMLVGVALPIAAHSGEADVLAVEATRASDGTYRFDITV